MVNMRDIVVPYMVLDGRGCTSASLQVLLCNEAVVEWDYES